MISTRRVWPFLLVCGVVLFGVGCTSSNEGKIVGKWKMASTPTGLGPEELKLLREASAYPFIEFKADGTLVHGIESSDPDVNDKLKQSKAELVGTGKYKLLTGDKVRISDLPRSGPGILTMESEGTFGVNVTGDRMTIKDSSRTLHLIRIE